MAIIRNGNPKNISIHHSAVKTSTGDLAELKARAKSYDNYHKTKSIGWNNDTPGEFGYKYIRYHYMIAKDGSLIQVQDDKYVLYANSDGANGDFNYWGINVMFDGNFQEERPTEAMMKTAVKLIREIEKKYDIDPRVRGHKEVAAASAPTACPGKYLGTHDSGWIKQLIANVNDSNYSTELVSECEKEKTKILELEKGIQVLAAKNDTLSGRLRDFEQKNAELTGEIEVLKQELKAESEKYATLMIEKKTLANTNAELVKELNELKESQVNFFQKMIEAILKIFNK